MAEENSHVQPDYKVNQNEEQRLNHLEFVQGATLHALMCFMNLYQYAKDKSGPFKPRVETVEGTIKTVVGPVYHKFHDVPKDVLKFVDRKVDQSVVEFDRRVPPTWKHVSFQAFMAAQKAPEMARAFAFEVKRRNVADTASEFSRTVYAKCEPMAKDLYSKYEPKAEECAVSAWRKLNKLPLFPQVAKVAVPTAAYCSEKYNEAVHLTVERGYRVSSYLPLVPTEKIARLFNGNVALNEPLFPDQSGAEVAVH